MNKRPFTEWFSGATKSGRDCLTIPPNITELPCGCKRGVKDKEFRIRRLAHLPWVHCNPGGCWKPLNLTVVPYRPKVGKELNYNYPRHAPHFVRTSC